MIKFDFLLIITFGVIGWFLATGKEKTQWVRLIDIFVYGPYLILLGTHSNYHFSEFEKMFLLFLGATTITYNARNYFKGTKDSARRAQ